MNAMDTLFELQQGKRGAGLNTVGTQSGWGLRDMQCALRATPAGFCYHVLNRGNARPQVFRKDAESGAFVAVFLSVLETPTGVWMGLTADVRAPRRSRQCFTP
jgi:hypothetical protein